ncbi:MAG: hypothetical protein AB7I59_25810 [Geminicoccaceae bacterium]
MLWIVAAMLAGSADPCSRALDPAVAGSVAALWGPFQLGVVVLVGLAASAPWTVILAPVPLLLGETGHLHILLAGMVGGQHALPHLWAKGTLTGALGLLALATLFREATGRREAGTAVACVVLGGSALALDVVQMGTGGQQPMLASLEEWCELGLESLFAAACLAVLADRRMLGRSARRFL